MDFLERTIERFFVRHDGARRWRIVILTLAAIMIFVTTYALILPALTLGTKEASEMDGIDFEKTSVTDTSQPIGENAIEEAVTSDDEKSPERNLSPFYWSFNSQQTAKKTAASSEIKKADASVEDLESEAVTTAARSKKSASSTPVLRTVTPSNDKDNPLGKPAADKKLVDRNDGTYDLTLSVTGKTSTFAEDRKADVTIILDTSSSMRKSLNGYTDGTGERINTAKTAIKTLTDTLYAQNTDENPDATRISLITFGNAAHIRTFDDGQIYTSDPDSFQRMMNGIDKDSITADENDDKISDDARTGARRYEGTNWEDALQKAEQIDQVGNNSEGKKLLRGGDVKHYVIFVSDGNPTFRTTLGNYYNGRNNFAGTVTPSHDQRYNNIGTKYDGAMTLLNGAIDDCPYDATYGYYYGGMHTYKKYHDDTHNPHGYRLYGTGMDQNAQGTFMNFSYMRADGTNSPSSGAESGPQPLGGYRYEDDGTRVTNYSSYIFNNKRCFNESLNEARDLKYGMSYGQGSNFHNEFYGIIAFEGGTSGSSGTSLAPEYMSKLVAYAHDVNLGDDEISDNFFDARNSTQIQDAFKNIAQQIIGDYYYNDVKITDTITDMTMMEAKGSADIPAEADFRYYRYGGKYGGSESDPQPFTPTQNAQYDRTTKQITWKPLGDSGHLEDGVTYVVKCRVWPSQEAYDIVTKLNNGTLSYSSLTADQKKQIYYSSSSDPGGDDKYHLYTNGDGWVNYDIKEDKTVISGGTSSTTHDDVVDDGTTDPLPIGNMPLTVDKVYVEKIWEGVDENVYKDYKVTFKIECTDDSTLSKEIELTNADALPGNDKNIWRKSIWVSPGLKVSQPSAVTLDAGHTYTVKEISVKKTNGETVPLSTFTYTKNTVKPFLIDSASVVTLLDGSGGTTGGEVAAMWGKNKVVQNAEMPETGGIGTLPYLMSGALIAGAAMILGMKSRRSKRKEEETG
jgi:LPXTG-motif cell wall-anchored protein